MLPNIREDSNYIDHIEDWNLCTPEIRVLKIRYKIILIEILKIMIHSI